MAANQDIPVDVRIIVATNEDLREAVRQGKFREDIYHRIAEFEMHLSPPSRTQGRHYDFCRSFLESANLQLEKEILGFDEEAKEKLKDYYWHGNLRELQNVVKRSVLLTQGDYIEADVLPHEIISPQY